MFADSPIFGVGQGNFFRLSSNIDLTQSIYMAQKGGENAHNYFLQILAEMGLVGTLVFIFTVAWPFFKIDRFSIIASPAVALLAIALGNVFSHPLLIRPNLILLAVFLSLIYAGLDYYKPKLSIPRVV
jgi:O-antigen ligase